MSRLSARRAFSSWMDVTTPSVRREAHAATQTSENARENQRESNENDFKSTKMIGVSAMRCGFASFQHLFRPPCNGYVTVYIGICFASVSFISGPPGSHYSCPDNAIGLVAQREFSGYVKLGQLFEAVGWKFSHRPATAGLVRWPSAAGYRQRRPELTPVDLISRCSLIVCWSGGAGSRLLRRRHSLSTRLSTAGTSKTRDRKSKRMTVNAKTRQWETKVCRYN